MELHLKSASDPKKNYEYSQLDQTKLASAPVKQNWHMFSDDRTWVTSGKDLFNTCHGISGIHIDFRQIFEGEVVSNDQTRIEGWPSERSGFTKHEH